MEFVSYAKQNICGRWPGRLCSHLPTDIKKKVIPCICSAARSGLPLQVADILHAAGTALGQLKLGIPGLQCLRLTAHAGNHRTQPADCSQIQCTQMTPGHCQLFHQLQKLRIKKICISTTVVWIKNLEDPIIDQIFNSFLCRVTWTLISILLLVIFKLNLKPFFPSLCLPLKP